MKDEGRKVRGTATIYSDDTLEFTPQGKGEPQKEVLTIKGKSSFYKTTGKTPKLVAHMVVDEKDPNWPDSMYGTLDDFVMKNGAQPVISKARPKGKVLANEDGLTVTVGDENLSIRMEINLKENLDYRTKMYDQFNEISRCLQRNSDFMKKRMKSLSNVSNK